jgi:NAD(P)-dependent dehydrogenase (short-subunit alcohol dehydrogenase family)
VFALVDQVADELGSVDVMVANAGIAQVKTLLDVTPDDLQKIFEVVSYLAGPDSDYMTGQSVIIDGGMVYS